MATSRIIPIRSPHTIAEFRDLVCGRLREDSSIAKGFHELARAGKEGRMATAATLAKMAFSDTGVRLAYTVELEKVRRRERRELHPRGVLAIVNNIYAADATGPAMEPVTLFSGIGINLCAVLPYGVRWGAGPEAEAAERHEVAEQALALAAAIYHKKRKAGWTPPNPSEALRSPVILTVADHSDPRRQNHALIEQGFESVGPATNYSIRGGADAHLITHRLGGPDPVNAELFVKPLEG